MSTAVGERREKIHPELEGDGESQMAEDACKGKSTMDSMSARSLTHSDTSDAMAGRPAFEPCVSLGGVQFDNVDMGEAIGRIEALVRRGKPSIVVTPNVDHLIRLQKDQNYRKIVDQAALVLADGQPIVWASKWFKTPLKQRVAGSDLVPAFCRIAAMRGIKLFFLGGDPGTAERAKAILEEKHPKLEIVGTYCPDFGFEHDEQENQRIVNAIRKAQPDVVLVGLGSPKQERWIAAHMDAYKAPVSIGVGICFSFICGEVKRAPKLFRKLGLEWFWRLINEPRKLWYRYLVRGTGLVPILFKEWRRRRRQPAPVIPGGGAA